MVEHVPTIVGAINCDASPGFFGLPTWHKYLEKVAVTNDSGVVTACTPKFSSINDTWLVAAAILDILLRVAALAAVAMVVWGGVQYIMSQDEPDKTKKARSTIINALIGLVISVAATTLITYIAGRF